MQQLVIDSNIIFSILIKPFGITHKLFEKLSTEYSFYIHEITLEELNKHHAKILKSSRLNAQDFESVKLHLLSKCQLISKKEISIQYYKEAEKLVEDIDMNDVDFIATILWLNSKLWTGDKVLYHGLKEKGFLQIINSQDLQTLF